MTDRRCCPRIQDPETIRRTADRGRALIARALMLADAAYTRRTGAVLTGPDADATLVLWMEHGGCAEGLALYREGHALQERGRAERAEFARVLTMQTAVLRAVDRHGLEDPFGATGVA